MTNVPMYVVALYSFQCGGVVLFHWPRTPCLLFAPTKSISTGCCDKENAWKWLAKWMHICHSMCIVYMNCVCMRLRSSETWKSWAHRIANDTDWPDINGPNIPSILLKSIKNFANEVWQHLSNYINSVCEGNFCFISLSFSFALANGLWWWYAHSDSFYLSFFIFLN